MIAQELLNLDSKQRSNVFAWRGQFSPQLVELFLKEYGRKGDAIFDPFAGSGTTLLEATKQGMRSRGTELNPSAFMMAQSVEWVRFSLPQREAFLREAGLLLREALVPAEDITAFENLDTQAQARHISLQVRSSRASREVKHVLANTLIRGMSGNFNFEQAFRTHCSLLRSLPHVETTHFMFNADARRTPLAESSIDLVITSPPYINVFNYHENNRPAMELLGWDILAVARAELGSNRKNRGNRFLTVVQYSLDMFDVFLELRRVLKDGAKAIFVVGRESMVRGISFENGELVASLAKICGFNVVLRQERSFLNRFGQRIYEDILHFENEGVTLGGDPRDLAIRMLEKKRGKSDRREVADDLESAISSAHNVAASPIYELTTN
jgi:DNA modification methylase